MIDLVYNLALSCSLAGAALIVRRALQGKGEVIEYSGKGASRPREPIFIGHNVEVKDALRRYRKRVIREEGRKIDRKAYMKMLLYEEAGEPNNRYFLRDRKRPSLTDYVVGYTKSCQYGFSKSQERTEELALDLCSALDSIENCSYGVVAIGEDSHILKRYDDQFDPSLFTLIETSAHCDILAGLDAMRSVGEGKARLVLLENANSRLKYELPEDVLVLQVHENTLPSELADLLGGTR